VWARIKRTWVASGIALTVVFVAWSLIAYRANTEAHAATISDAVVANARDHGVWKFLPLGVATPPPVGLLFFPGALVDPAAYAPLARAVAAAGFPVVLVELPRRGAFGGADDPELLGRARDQMRKSGGPRRWVIGGHSRGAVVAADLAGLRTRDVVGLVLIGTTHPRDVDLAALRIPVTKVVGTNDPIAPERKSQANRHLLPASTRWVRVEGGNHSQFGWYGFQPGDHFAGITAAQQRTQMLAAILDLLGAARDSAPPAVAGQDLIALAKLVPAMSLDSTLPALPFERWLAGLRGTPVSEIAWESNDCGEGGDGRDAPTCVEASIRLGADSTARASLIVAGIDGKGGAPAVWDLSAGVGNSFVGFRTLQSWAAYVRTSRP
jgi:pimeloyl-ACP methyl ester carboxylesterase